MKNIWASKNTIKKVDQKPLDFPGGAVDKNPPANAGGKGSIPGRGTKIPHAVGRGQKINKQINK